jgi:hypothetical protein
VTKKPKTGGEVDAYCTKCKLDLGHRIIAMVGDAIKKVECRTCGSHHLYRRPKAEKDAAHARAAEKRAERAEARGDGPAAKTGGPRLTAAQKLERSQTASWEHAIAGKPATAFKPYRVTQSFDAGELVRHPKFGDGVVSRVIDRGKVEVLFKDGPKTMAHGQ